MSMLKLCKEKHITLTFLMNSISTYLSHEILVKVNTLAATVAVAMKLLILQYVSPNCQSLKQKWDISDFHTIIDTFWEDIYCLINRVLYFSWKKILLYFWGSER